MHRIFAALVLALLGAGPLSAQIHNGQKLVEATLVADTTAMVPGKPFRIGLHLRMAPGWHTYWENPGDSGLATTLKLELPEGFASGPLVWPLPQRLVEPGDIQVYAYKGETLLTVTITPPPEATAPVEIKARATWLVCEAICIPGSADLSLTLPVETSAAPANTGLFAKFDALLPTSEPPPFETRWTPTPTGWNLGLRGITDARTADFFPFAGETTSPGHTAPREVADGNADISIPITPSAPVRGVVVLENGSRRGWIIGSGIGTPEASAAMPAPPAPRKACRVPLEHPGLRLHRRIHPQPHALRASGHLVEDLRVHAAGRRLPREHHEARPRLHRRHLRLVPRPCRGHRRAQGGRKRGDMGVPVPEPLVQPRHRRGRLRFRPQPLRGLRDHAARTRGIEPCRGRRPQRNLRLFRARNSRHPAGHALHRTVPRRRPRFRIHPFPDRHFRRLPRDRRGHGIPLRAPLRKARMDEIPPQTGPVDGAPQAVHGLPLIATLLWLLYVIGQQRGAEAVIWAAATYLCLGFGAWLYGAFLGPISSPRAKWLASAGIAASLALAIGYFAGNLFAGAVASVPSAKATTNTDGIPWVPFSQDELDKLLAEGRPVFLDFTADWCITCKVNERTAINTRAVREAFAKLGIVPMKADWTNSNPEITRKLAQFDRVGVPFYLFYAPGRADDPVILPELLTEQIVLRSIGADKP